MIQSLERASTILHLFEQQPDWGITQIAEQMQLSKSTVFGLVSTLEHLGFLSKKQDTDRYCLGLELYRLGNLVDTDIRQMILPELTMLSNLLEETINYVRPDGSDVVYLLKKESPHSMRICTKIGQRYPMYATAVGKVILAFLPRERQETILRAVQFRAYTKHTIMRPEILEESLEQIRAQGFALDREELEYGLVCVAVPVFNNAGIPIAALSCSGPKMRMSEKKIAQCVQQLQLSARKLRDLV